MEELESTGSQIAIPEDLLAAPFVPGVRVALRQYSMQGDQAFCLNVAAVEIVARPRIGERLEVRIQGESGLASSRIQQLEPLSEGRVAVVTNGRVYVLSRLDDRLGSDELSAIQETVTRLLAAHQEVPQPEATEHVRIPDEICGESPNPFVGVRVRVERFSLTEASAKSEHLGSGTLLAEPEIGEALRFLDAYGHVMTTSNVAAIISKKPDILEVSTGNRCYRFVLEPVL
ncbi:MAG: hypothetical protein GY723_05475 [bacterium]|nr:hypothetical protein [bacterium]MCP5065798.1 hypothetical protein [bacterium]